MSRELRASGYIALTLQMLWGIYNVYLLSPGGPDITQALIGGHAHFGVLGILAVVTGLAIERTELAGTLRNVAVWGFIAGQWLLPATVLMEMVFPPLLITAYLWGILLTISMGLIAWGTVTASDDISRPPQAAAAD